MDTKHIKSNPVRTVLVITLGMMIVYLVTKWQWSFTTALVVGIAGLISNYLARKIDLLWMKLTWVLSLIVPNILLSVVYYLFLTPIALLSKVFGQKDQLLLKNERDSLFKESNKVFNKASFERPW